MGQEVSRETGSAKGVEGKGVEGKGVGVPASSAGVQPLEVAEEKEG